VSRKPLFTGGISDQDLHAHLAALLGCDPMTDNRVLLWAVWRFRLHALRRKKNPDGKPVFTRRQLLTIDQGWPIPPAGSRMSEPGTPHHGRGRPVPRGMNFANKYLLQIFPQLASDPLSFAGLERLHRVDYGNKVPLLPTPEEWPKFTKDPTSRRQAKFFLNKVRNRSKDRIRRALKQEGIPGLPDGVEPHARRVQRPANEPTAEEISRMLASLPPMTIRDLKIPSRSEPNLAQPEPGDAMSSPEANPKVDHNSSVSPGRPAKSKRKTKR
jgi:hypothetical protein